MHTDFVIQISPLRLDAVAIGGNADGVAGSQIIVELHRWLRPGAEISLVSRGYQATTSILWLSGPLPNRTFRACVRLIAVSAPPVRELA